MEKYEGEKLVGFTQANVKMFTFEACDLTNAHFIDLDKVEFLGCDLTNATFEGPLHNVDFFHCKLNKTDLSGTRLTHVTFDGSLLVDAVLPGFKVSADLGEGSPMVVSE